jgi:hypothetical protein
MWLIAAAIYFSFKWLAWRSSRVPADSLARKTAWWLGWMRMDPAEFLGSDVLPADYRPTWAEWRYAAGNVAAGVLLFALGSACVAGDWPLLGGWCGMFGLVLMLHFGVFHLISCAWRSAGVKALPLMNRPLCSTSLGEFWGRRWNRAFHDTAYAALFRPLA